MFNNVYSGRNVLVTGHTGFKGSWLTLWLSYLNAKVTGLSIDIPTNPSMFADLNLDADMNHIVGDIRDLESLMEVMNKNRPEIIFHLAAQPIVKSSYLEPHKTFTTNTIGTLNVLEAARKCDSVRAVVLITSDKCYRNQEWSWGYRETDQLGGEDPYSASKGGAELIAYSYMHSFFSEPNTPNIATVRAGNVIGGGDWALYRIIPDCVRAWIKNEKVMIRNPNSTRPWQHVLEPLSGYLNLGAELFRNNKNVMSESFNFGPDANINKPVSELISALDNVWKGSGFVYSGDVDNAHPEAGLLKLCCDKALSSLSWKPTLDFEKTVEFTANWYINYSKGANMHQLSCDQIEQYTHLAKDSGMSWSLGIDKVTDSINTEPSVDGSRNKVSKVCLEE